MLVVSDRGRNITLPIQVIKFNAKSPEVENLFLLLLVQDWQLKIGVKSKIFLKTSVRI